jgi:hypothetical protein
MRRREFIQRARRYGGLAVRWESLTHSNNATMTGRINLDHCFGAIIDVQEFFLSRVAKRARSRMMINTRNFCPHARLFQNSDRGDARTSGDQKGSLPNEIGKHLKPYGSDVRKRFVRSDEREKDQRPPRAAE